MKVKDLFLSLSLVFVSVLVQAENKVTFFEEHIDFNLDAEHFSINGIYSFHNTTNNTVYQHILFPFAVKVNVIDSIRILDLNRLTEIKYNVLDSAVSFNLCLLPNDTLDINLFYRQKTSTKNTYIITTTKYWGKPLDKAVYTLTIPKETIIDSFSYAPDTMRIIPGKKLYIWDKSDFSPQLDFDVILKK